MSASDALSAVARDLALLGPGDRRAILRALEPAERRQVATAMREKAKPVAAVPALPPSAHSLWLEGLLADAASDRGRMTTAARAAIREAAGRSTIGTAARVPGRSLLQAAGGLLLPAKTR